MIDDGMPIEECNVYTFCWLWSIVVLPSETMTNDDDKEKNGFICANSEMALSRSLARSLACFGPTRGTTLSLAGDVEEEEEKWKTVCSPN